MSALCARTLCTLVNVLVNKPTRPQHPTGAIYFYKWACLQLSFLKQFLHLLKINFNLKVLCSVQFKNELTVDPLIILANKVVTFAVNGKILNRVNKTIICGNNNRANYYKDIHLSPCEQSE